MVAHRNLSRGGLRLVMVLLAGASLLIGVLFWSLGAWPVPGFCGVEVLLAWLLLHRHARAGQASETILLERDGLVVRRTDAHGARSEIRLAPYWLRVEVQDRPASPVRVRLVERSVVREEVGRLLGEDGRRRLAQDLRAALLRCR